MSDATDRGAADGAAAPVLVERRESVLLLTLNRPDRLNAVSLDLYRSLTAHIESFDEDPSLRACVVTGAGRAFCVGADLKSHAGEDASADEAPAIEVSAAERRAYVSAAQTANRAIQDCGKLVIAAVNGHAIGGGLELALSCDLVGVASAAKLRFPELALGTFVGGGVTRTLQLRVGYARARELLYLADFFSGDDAAAWGLANWALPVEAVLEVAMDWARRAADLAPGPVRLAKALLGEAIDLSRDRLLQREAQALLAVMETEDWKEGIRAFNEKREPRFTGR